MASDMSTELWSVIFLICKNEYKTENGESLTRIKLYDPFLTGLICVRYPIILLSNDNRVCRVIQFISPCSWIYSIVKTNFLSTTQKIDYSLSFIQYSIVDWEESWLHVVITRLDRRIDQSRPRSKLACH